VNQKLEPRVRDNAVVQLIFYAVATGNSQVFVNAMEGVGVKQILARKQLRVMFFVGQGFFVAKEV